MKIGNNTFLKHLKKDELRSPVVFWDTSFPAAIILEESERKEAAIDFANKLIKEKIQIVFSSHVCAEYLNLTIKNKIRIGEKFATNKLAMLLIEKDPSIISKYQVGINKSVQAFQELIGMFNNVKIVLPTEPIVSKSIIDVRRKYRLDINDAIHAGTMLVSEERNLVTFDSDFNKIDGINIWSKFDKSVK